AHGDLPLSQAVQGHDAGLALILVMLGVYIWWGVRMYRRAKSPRSTCTSTRSTARDARGWTTCRGGALELPQAIEGAPLALGGPAGAGDARGRRSPPRARRIRR